MFLRPVSERDGYASFPLYDEGSHYKKRIESIARNCFCFIIPAAGSATTFYFSMFYWKSGENIRSKEVLASMGVGIVCSVGFNFLRKIMQWYCTARPSITY